MNVINSTINVELDVSELVVQTTTHAPNDNLTPDDTVGSGQTRDLTPDLSSVSTQPSHPLTDTQTTDNPVQTSDLLETAKTELVKTKTDLATAQQELETAHSRILKQNGELVKLQAKCSQLENVANTG